MLLQQEDRDVSKSGVMEMAKATIKATPKIFSFFADQTYANKPRAIARELVANAVDSHVMAGKPSLEVEVWLPNLIDPVFKVRDFGLGMAHEFMMTGFMAYTDGSTKDNSNVAIGGFGIGSKSPFAYVDQYTIKSTFDGTVSIYSVFKDDDGIPSIGLLAQKSTDEPNGVEVSFPVEPNDFENFREAAFEALRYFQPLPLIRNAGTHKFEAIEYASKGKNWGMRKESGALQVIMGGVMYPVDAANLSYKFSDETAKQMLNYGLDIVVPIGTCSIALSREQLSYDNRTVQGLTDACLNVVDEVSNSFSTMFDQHPTLWDARAALHEETNPGGRRHYGQSVRGKFLADRALYKGISLSIAFTFDIGKPIMVWDLEPANYRRGGKTPNPKWEHYPDHYMITPGRYEMVVIDDLPRNSKSKTIIKMKEWLADQPQEKRILVIRAENETVSAKKILAALENPTNYILTSSLPEPSVGVKTASGALRPKVRMFTYDGHLSYNWSGNTYHETLQPGRYGKTGVAEIAYADQPASGILVVMENFKPPAGFYDKMKIGLVPFEDLHFVNGGDAVKLDENSWQKFDDVFKKALDKELAKVQGLGEMLAVEQAFPRQAKAAFERQDLKLPVRSSLGKLEKIFTTYVKPIKADNRKFGPFVDVALPKGVDPEKMWDDFKTSSPRAFRLLELFDYRVNNPADLKFLHDNL